MLLFTYLYTTANCLYYLNSYSQLQKLSNFMHPDVAKWWKKNIFPTSKVFVFGKTHLKRQKNPSLVKYLAISLVCEIKVMHKLNLHLCRNHTYISLNLRSPSTKKGQSPAQPWSDNPFDLILGGPKMGGTKSSSKYSHFEYSISMFLKAKLNQLEFAQEWAQHQMNVLKSRLNNHPIA